MKQNDELLTAFLYILMRDFVTPGKVEAIIAEHVEWAALTNARYSNEHLVKYARELAERLTGKKK